jgi:hypothetical protein
MNFYYNASGINDFFTLSGTTLTTDYSLVVNGGITANSLSLASGKFTVASNGNTVIDAVLQANQAIIRELKVDKLTLIYSTPSFTDAFTGSGTLTAGSTKVTISNTNVETDSIIIVTPKTKTPQSLSVTNRTPGVGFKVEIDTAVTYDIEFDFWIIDRE